MTKLPLGLLLDQARRSRVRPGEATSIGGAGCGVQSIGTRLGAPHANAYLTDCVFEAWTLSDPQPPPWHVKVRWSASGCSVTR